jgi:hypothetical protein
LGDGDWELNQEQKNLVDQLTRLNALEDLRTRAQASVGEILGTLGKSLGRDLLRKFPAEEFGGAPGEAVGDQEPWLGVAWPRFGRFEFWKGKDALCRYRALESYFGPQPASAHRDEPVKADSFGMKMRRWWRGAGEQSP